MEIQHSIEITAPIQQVWELTADVGSWPDFTPTMTSVELLDDAPLAVGSTARVKQPGQPAKVWTVTEHEPPNRFAWETRSLGTKMTATHTLEGDDQAMTNTLTITLAGPLASVLGRAIRRPTIKALTQENQGFKTAAERPSS